ncbi:MAG: radical SAM family heme chaperone HemW [Holophagales bacterium]|nr:radical SAM family heme chaperone HemW [Holophagales bacterium]
MNLLLSESLKSISLDQYLGLYIHVPFCRDRCTYCSFASSIDLSLEPSYIKRVVRDLKTWGNFFGRPRLDTIYLGGGTPSVLSLHSLQLITQAIHDEFDATDLSEATLEVNPGTLSPDWLKVLRRTGWDRISLGIQTLDNALLQHLGRVHSAEQAITAVKMCGDAGYNRISADLLIGVPEQHLEDVMRDAACLIEAGVEHLSIYLLDLDKQCRLKSQIDNGLLELPTDDQVAETYQALQKQLPHLGFIPYEISNYSRPGHHSAHNIRYWQRRPYIGIGPSAASNIGNLRWTENEDIPNWINGFNEPEIQLLSPEESLAEIPLLALRMHSGINWRILRELAEAKGLGCLIQNWENELAPFIRHGLLQQEGENLCLTSEGMLVSNQIFQIFVF